MGSGRMQFLRRDWAEPSMHGRFAYTLNTRATSDLQPGHCASRHFSKMIQAAFLFWKQPLPDGLFMQEIANSCAWNTRVLRSWKTHLIGSATCWTLLALPVAAQSFDKDWSVYGQAGRSPHSQRNTNDATLGVTAPLLEPWEWVGGKLSSHWDISVATWRAPAFVAGRSTYTLISAIPTLRYRAETAFRLGLPMRAWAWSTLITSMPLPTELSAHA
jgi:hypothetical protein